MGAREDPEAQGVCRRSNNFQSTTPGKSLKRVCCAVVRQCDIMIFKSRDLEEVTFFPAVAGAAEEFVCLHRVQHQRKPLCPGFKILSDKFTGLRGRNNVFGCNIGSIINAVVAYRGGASGCSVSPFTMLPRYSILVSCAS